MTSLLVWGITGPASPLAMAFEVGLGLASVDEGDDRAKPGATLQVGFTQDYQARLHYWGETFGPISTDSLLIAATRRFPLFKLPQLTGGFGLAAINERITLDFRPEDEVTSGAARDRAEDNYNFGAAISFAWELQISNLFMAASWDAYIFPAGVVGGLFLSSGRKQLLSVTFGFGV